MPAHSIAAAESTRLGRLVSLLAIAVLGLVVAAAVLGLAVVVAAAAALAAAVEALDQLYSLAAARLETAAGAEPIAAAARTHWDHSY